MSTRNHPVSIRGTIQLADGSETEFSIDPADGWQQWGNDTERLGETVALLDDIAQACNEYFAQPDNEW